MAYVVTTSMSDRYHPSFDWDRWPLGYRLGLYDAVEVNPEHMAKRAFLTSRHKSVPDLFSINGLFTVCEGFRDAVEKLEPNVHQFIPIDLRRKNGKLVARKPYYLFNVLQKVDAIIVAKSNVKWFPPRPESEVTFLTRAPGKESYTMSRSRIAGRHVWRGDEHFPGSVYFSEDLKAEVDRAKWKKLDIVEVEEVDEEWDPAENLRPPSWISRELEKMRETKKKQPI